MKNNFFIYIGLIFFIITCRMPSDPLGEISIIKRLETIDTNNNYLDIDVDMEDSILVAVASYNGYFVYNINSVGGTISDIVEKIHIGADAMDNSLGDNRAQAVILSKNHNVAFIMDELDHIWLYKYGDGATQFSPPNQIGETCYGGSWLSVAIGDKIESIGVYTLLKHYAAEFMPYCINSTDLNSIGTDQGCSDIEQYIATELNTQTSCEGTSGYIWMYPGCRVGQYNEYSTSLVWSNLNGVNPSSTSPNQDKPNCEYIINQGLIAEKIYFDDGLLSMAYGELGVRVFQQTEAEVCLVGNTMVALPDNPLCGNYTNQTTGNIDYKSCCENVACPGGVGNCPWYETGNIDEGLGGIFSSTGGIIPKIYAEFDTPGEVEAIFSTGSTIFAGLNDRNGCVMATLDNNGSVITTYQFAKGYTVNGIHQDNGLLALAGGRDGILLYNWNGSNIRFMGKIQTSYANNVKVAGNIIFAATKYGIDIFQINFTP